VVLACYLGADNTGIHLLGPLAKKVLRIAPPLVITPEQACQSTELMVRILSPLCSVK
jgi:4-aminobutyrate aminotransferase-like enzyme